MIFHSFQFETIIVCQILCDGKTRCVECVTYAQFLVYLSLHLHWEAHFLQYSFISTPGPPTLPSKFIHQVLFAHESKSNCAQQVELQKVTIVASTSILPMIRLVLLLPQKLVKVCFLSVKFFHASEVLKTCKQSITFMHFTTNENSHSLRPNYK